METIYIASDHAGFELKKELKVFLATLGYQVIDKGPLELNPEDDYPELVLLVAQEVLRDKNSKGIVIGGSGQGEAMVCNRLKDIRAVVFNGQYEPKDGRTVPNEIRVSREHNDANILSLGARFINAQEAKIAVNLWLGTKFSNDPRHIRRIKQIDELTK
jgi:ribose 5-phosphate isomerase B